ncbi:MAG TPA: DEAD/DEAH box helicase [Kofleriaceae bacterium]|nr:DEAD/DEAH box helicase [Kofleriaceae bacterium]
MQFSDLGLAAPLLRAAQTAGYQQPTPIQREAIPPVLAGRDVLGCAQTGTGKTAAFAMPILQRLAESAGKKPRLRALVLTPTRELASQVADSFRTYGKGMRLSYSVVFGGVSDRPQIATLRRGVDALIATPGRLLDLMQQGHVHLEQIEYLVLDEADRMLDMGFLPDVKRVIAKIPAARQTLLFSATMPPDIRSLADSLLSDPVRVAVTPVASTVEAIAQRLYFVDKKNKPRLLVDLLQNDAEMRHTLVFTRTKHGANRVVEKLDKIGLRAAAIHGNKSQAARERAMNGFRSGKIRLLIATDIAARGIDVDGITHVINYDLPNEPETYVHRIGRTGRAGATGIAVSFCDVEERAYLKDIERLTKQHIDRVDDHAYPASERPPAPTDLSGHRSGPRPNPRNARNSRNSRSGSRPGSRSGSRPSSGSGSRPSSGSGSRPASSRRRSPRASSRN